MRFADSNYRSRSAASEVVLRERTKRATNGQTAEYAS